MPRLNKADLLRGCCKVVSRGRKKFYRQFRATRTCDRCGRQWGGEPVQQCSGVIGEWYEWAIDGAFAESWRPYDVEWRERVAEDVKKFCAKYGRFTHNAARGERKPYPEKGPLCASCAAKTIRKARMKKGKR